MGRYACGISAVTTSFTFASRIATGSVPWHSHPTAHSLRNQSIVVDDLKSEAVSAALPKCSGGMAFSPDGRTLIAAGNRFKKLDGKESMLPGVAFFSAGDPTIHGETFVFRAE